MAKKNSSLKSGPKTEPVKGQSIDSVYNQLKTMMYNQELAPGQKLIYQNLARRLKASTTPILQALNRLENAKLVRYEPNRGYFVEEINETEVRELYQAREALEIYLIPILVEKLTPKDIDSIRNSFRAHSDLSHPDSRRMLMIRDASFHMTVARFAGHQVISDLLEKVFERIYLKYRAEYLGEERIQGVFKQHRAILDALQQKDVKKAAEVTREHLRSGMEHVVDSLKNRTSNRMFDGTIPMPDL